jgi:hypothetical protein
MHPRLGIDVSHSGKPSGRVKKEIKKEMVLDANV